jgi:uncharacterized membrane protein
MSSLVVVVYPQEYRAEEVLETLTRLEREDLADLDDAWFVRRSLAGRMRLNRPINLPPSHDVSSAAWDVLVGSLCVAPLVGADECSGTAAGRALGEIGVSERFIREIGRTLVPESSAIVAPIRRVDADRVLRELVPYGGTVMQSSLIEDPALQPPGAAR